MNHLPANLSRRGALSLGAGSALTAMLAACSNDSSTSKSATSGTASSGAAAEGKFPQTVESVYGNVTVSKKPSRTVALWVPYADICVALGVQPVAVASDAKDIPSWAKGRFSGKLDGAIMPEFGKPSIERTGSYHPDIIIGGSFTVDKDTYPRMSKVAPGYFGRTEGTENWKHLVDDLSLLLTGSAAKGTEVKKQVEASMAPYRERLRGLQGKKYQWVAAGDTITFGGGSALEDLGLVPAANQDGKSSTDLSYENIAQLDADVLAIFPRDASARKKLEADPRFAQLPSSKNKTVIWADGDHADAMQSSCPTSFTYIADWAVPLLEKSKLNTQG